MSTSENLICVIEDNKPIRKLYCTLLKKAGFQTVDFNDGQPAIEWLSANSPHCVICDILLPDMNGTEILAFIRNKTDGAKIPVIASTGFANDKDRDKYLELGFDHYIPKPVNTSTFVDEIKDVISSKN